MPISADDVVFGRTATFPIYDHHGVLLVSEGTLITDDIMEKLTERPVEHWRTEKRFAKKLPTRLLEANRLDVTTKYVDREALAKIDTVLDSGFLMPKNRGAAVKSSMVHLGKQAYDPRQRARISYQHEKNSNALQELMQRSLNDEQITGDQIAGMAASYLQEMTADCDAMINTALQDFRSSGDSREALQTSLLSMAIGIDMNLDADNVRHLGMVGLVHDWGMAFVPAHLRGAQRRLSRMELLEIRKHPIYSFELLQKVTALPSVVPLVAFQIHERFDGSGYPRGRRGNQIPLLARIVQVADMYIAMTSSRPHRGPLMRYSAMEQLIKMSKDQQIDPDVMRAMLRIQSLCPLGNYVSLSDGSIGMVIRANREHYTKPVVQLTQDKHGEPINPEEESSIIDLAESSLTIRKALRTPGSNEVTAPSPWD